MTETSQLLNRHRSIRSYKPDPIDPALVEQVCGDAIAGGLSSGNFNSVSMVLTRGPERKRRVYELHFQQEISRGTSNQQTAAVSVYRHPLERASPVGLTAGASIIDNGLPAI